MANLVNGFDLNTTDPDELAQSVDYLVGLKPDLRGFTSIAERVPPLAGHLEAIDEQRCVLATGSHSLDMLALYIAAVGEDFEIEEPPELARAMRRLAERLARVTAP